MGVYENAVNVVLPTSCGCSGLKAVGARSGARYHMAGERVFVQMAKQVDPARHMLMSSANMPRMILSIWCSSRLRLEGGRLAFIMTYRKAPDPKLAWYQEISG